MCGGRAVRASRAIVPVIAHAMARPVTKLSVSDAARWTGDFLRREWRLVAPVAFAFMALPGLAVQLLVPGARRVAAEVTQVQPWMGWLLPVIALGLIGALAVSALALVPRVSVGEALTRAAARLWVILVGWILVIAALSLAIVVVLAALSFAGALLGMSAITLTGLGVAVSFLAMILAGTRLLPIIPLVATGSDGPFAALKRAWAMTRGHFWQLFGALLLLVAAAAILSYAVGLVLGVAAQLVGRATGQEQALTAVAAALVSLVGAGLSAAFYVFVAAIYRQLRD